MLRAELRPEFIEALDAANSSWWFVFAWIIPPALIFPSVAWRWSGCIVAPVAVIGFYVAFVGGYWNLKGRNQKRSKPDTRGLARVRGWAAGPVRSVCPSAEGWTDAEWGVGAGARRCERVGAPSDARSCRCAAQRVRGQKTGLFSSRGSHVPPRQAHGASHRHVKASGGGPAKISLHQPTPWIHRCAISPARCATRCAAPSTREQRCSSCSNCTSHACGCMPHLVSVASSWHRIAPCPTSPQRPRARRT